MRGDEAQCKPKFIEVVCRAKFSRAKLRFVIPATGEICVSLAHESGQFAVAHFDREDIADWLTTACLVLKVERLPGSPE